ncbi:MAG: iron-sulfur cluster assembly protein, partial [Pseudomonadota bacterium]
MSVIAFPKAASARGASPEDAQIWRWLEDVPDPEVPVVSVVDLGIVRDVAASPDETRVTITPTYS